MPGRGRRRSRCPSLSQILSHPQGLEQCSQFLQSLPNATPTTYFDTAGAMAGGGGGGRSEQSPRSRRRRPPPRYGLVGAAARHLRFRRQLHQVRGAVPRPDAPSTCGFACKTSLILVTGHEEGDLLRCLEVLSGSGHSMTKLESRPRPGRPGSTCSSSTSRATPPIPGPRPRWTNCARRRCSSRSSAATRPRRCGPRPSPAASGPGGRRAARAARLRDADPAEMLEAVAAAARPAAGRSRHYRLVDRAARQDDTVIRVGDVLVGGDGFVVMAGPCSVESSEQIGATARFVRDHGAHVLRGGVFKPRTSPYAFQGLGWEGLDLLVARRARDRPAGGHRGDGRGPGAADGAGADILQVGARNMQNFDLLRELGKAGPAGAAQARPVQHHRGMAGGRRVHRRPGQSAGHPLRARDQDVRERHPQHPRPVRGGRDPRAVAPAGHRRPQPRHRACAATSRRWPGRPAPRAPTACSSRSTRTRRRRCPTPTRAWRSTSSPR